MNFLQFTDVTYSYPATRDEDVQNETSSPIFDHFSAQLPGDFVCLTGPNGSGKSTFLLLGGGRILPGSGSVSLCGVDTRALADENARNALCSFIYQNMEFETADTVRPLLEFVYENGGHSNKSDAFLREVVSAFELEQVLGKTLTGISKGEIQRVLLAFSVLYGSRCIFMDEPLFALEERQKEAALDYLRGYSIERHVPVYIAMHELELTRKFAQTVLLFYPDRTIELGTPEEVLTAESLEAAYGVPKAMLRDGERLNEKRLREEWEQMHSLH